MGVAHEFVEVGHEYEYLAGSLSDCPLQARATRFVKAWPVRRGRPWIFPRS
jgi:hypothetical protein